jgi:hypothetical protein
MVCGSANNMIEFAAPRCQITDLSYGDRAGLQTSSVTIACLTDTALADSDFAIYFR